MANKTFVIIEIDPDGDNYQIHTKFKEAQKAFNKSKQKGTLWAEGSIYLVQVKDKKFGFLPTGEIYGAELIQSHKFIS